MIRKVLESNLLYFGTRTGFLEIICVAVVLVGKRESLKALTPPDNLILIIIQK